MTKWQKNPPTVTEWRSIGGHGYWWMKYLIVESSIDEEDGDQIVWPEVWHTEIVYFTSSPKPGHSLFDSLFDDNLCMLHGRTVLSRTELDLQKLAEDPNTYWQPVEPALDNDDNSRPRV